MSFITREEFVSKPPTFKDVDVPELGDGKQIRVYQIGAREKVRYMSGFWTIGPDGKAGFDASGCRTRLLILTCRTEDGTPIFTDEDAALLEGFDANVIERLAEAAEVLSGLDATTEELRELFRRAQNSASPTA
jgi:hypothetical protein